MVNDGLANGMSGLGREGNTLGEIKGGMRAAHNVLPVDKIGAWPKEVAFSYAMKQVPSVQIWSATPTPLTSDLTIDLPSVEKMIREAIASGIQGVFLAGTCGEGPWLPDRERVRLVRAVAAEARGRLKI